MAKQFSVATSPVAQYTTPAVLVTSMLCDCEVLQDGGQRVASGLLGPVDTRIDTRLETPWRCIVGTVWLCAEGPHL